MRFNVFIPNKKGHYSDYSLFLEQVLKGNEVVFCKSFKQKFAAIFQIRSSIIFLDIDDNPDYLWLMFRFFFSKLNFGVSVSAETLLQKKFSLSYWNHAKKRALKKWIKYYVIRFFTVTRRFNLISIHKDTSYENDLKSIVSLLTYDFQYYDLKYLNYNIEKIDEFDTLSVENKNNSVLIVNNTSTAKKNLDDLKEWIESEKNLFFIIVCKAKFLEESKLENVYHIDKYVSNEELIYLIKNSAYIYCYYSNNRPSGFMGRSMQLRKKVIVPANGYLGSIPYPNSIKLNSLKMFNSFLQNKDFSKITESDFKNFDESQKLISFLLRTK